MTPPPPPPAVVSPAVIQESRILLAIIGGLICLLGLGILCGGGFGVTMLATMPFAKFTPPEVAEEERAALEALTQAVHRFQPLIAPAVVSAAVSCLTASAALIWLGIGTIQGRRWARKLLLAAGWGWCGSVALQFIGFLSMLPALMTWVESIAIPGPGGAPGTGSVAFSMAIQVVMNLISYAMSATPGVALIVLFSLRNVRLTCEQLDPGPNWTDRIPIEVLPLFLTLAVWSLQALTALPLIPGLVTLLPPELGWNGAAVLSAGLTVALLVTLSTWLVARMNPIGWWVLCAGTIVGTGLICLAHLRSDFPAIFRAALNLIPMPEAERAKFEQDLPPGMMENFGSFLQSCWVVVAVTGAAFLGYLGWIKRHFEPEAVRS